MIRKFFLTFVGVIFFSNIASAAELPVTSNFGWRIHPISGEWKFHAGVDLGYDEGSAVIALFDGVIVQAGNYSDGYGNQVLIYHRANDTYTRYAHMSGIAVRINSQVSRGQVIGYVGATGNVTGPHLHLEYIIPSGNGQYVYSDPLILWR